MCGVVAAFWLDSQVVGWRECGVKLSSVMWKCWENLWVRPAQTSSFKTAKSTNFTNKYDKYLRRRKYNCAAVMRGLAAIKMLLLHYFRLLLDYCDIWSN